jgi:NAD kinase
VIFSTALGSTGYAYSAGGKEFEEKGKYELIPVAPHRRRLKPMFASLTSPSELKILSRYKHDLVDVVIDGQIIYEMGLHASLIIRKAKRTVSLFVV